MAAPVVGPSGPPLGRRPPRTVLQVSAVRNRQRHLARASARVAGLVLLDTLAITLVLFSLSALLTRISFFGSAGAFLSRDLLEDGTLQTITALCTGLCLVGAYRGGDSRRDANRVASGLGLGLLVALWQPLWIRFDESLLTLVLAGAMLIAAVVLGRWSADKILKALWPAGTQSIQALLVGTPRETAHMRQVQALGKVGSYDIVAVLDPSIERGMSRNGTQIYGMSDLPTVIQSQVVDTIILCGQLDDQALAHLVLSAEAAGCRVMSPSRAFSLANLTPSVHWQDGSPMVELTRPGLRGRDLLLKRLVDLAVAAATMALVAPIMALVALCVRLSSPGPVVFCQKRVGYSGELFTIYKFRTMYADAEDRLAALKARSVYGDGKLFKMASDPRITPLGRFLRKTSLDELPQLFNVLRGEMSLVGPRPPLPREVELYRDDEFIRFGMKPGITGPWQVSGRNRITSFDDVLRIESAYFSGWTIWRDFRILARTVPAVLKMDGAQ